MHATLAKMDIPITGGDCIHSMNIDRPLPLRTEKMVTVTDIISAIAIMNPKKTAIGFNICNMID